MNKDPMVTTIDWQLSEPDFRVQIQRMVATSRAQGKVIVLPVRPDLDTLMLLLTQVHCDHCDAPCCKTSPPDDFVDLAPSEFKAIEEKYGTLDLGWSPSGRKALKMPCRFLYHSHRTSEGTGCSIYDERPLVCMVYPLQPGGTLAAGSDDRQEMLSVASSCPEARRIAKALYMGVWAMQRKAAAIGVEEMKRMLGDPNYEANLEAEAQASEREANLGY